MIRRVLLGIVLYFSGPWRLTLQKISLWILLYRIFSDSLNMKRPSSLPYLGSLNFTSKDPHMGPNLSFFRFVKNMSGDSSLDELYQAFFILLKLIKLERGTRQLWCGIFRGFFHLVVFIV
jgi:hypothetical protein